MGRGRAKAKQTKVARHLKYSSPEMDLDSLQRELSNERPHEAASEEDYAKWEEWGPDSSGR